jgi:hypothetical protein
MTATLTAYHEMKLETRRHRLGRWRKRGETKSPHYALHYARFVDRQCYFANPSTGDAKRRIHLDLEMYWYGLQRRNVPLLRHARRHFIQHAYQSWPRVSAQVIRMLFHDPRFVLLGELKEYAVRVARDYICRRGRCSSRLTKMCCVRIARWKQREFHLMLQEELAQTWVTGKYGAHRPSNTWHRYEERYRSDLAGIDTCNDRF